MLGLDKEEQKLMNVVNNSAILGIISNSVFGIQLEWLKLSM